MKLSDFNIVEETKDYYTAFCLWHNDVNTPNLKIQKRGEYTGHYKCWACGRYGVVDDMDKVIRNKTKIRRQQPVPINWTSLNNYYIKQGIYHVNKILKLANEIQVEPQALIKLGIGWDGSAHTFPIFNANIQPIGIMRRFSDGKNMVRGSCVGIYVPYKTIPTHSYNTLLICEGMSDTAAMLSIYSNVIGAYNCETPIDIIYEYIYRVKCKRVVMFPDGDTPGLCGFNKIAAKIMSLAETVIYPMPLGYDVRGYLNNSPDEAKKYILGSIYG